MKCLYCHSLFEPSDEEVRHAREVAPITKDNWKVACREINLPHYCSKTCFAKSREKQISKLKPTQQEGYLIQNRWQYHIGKREPVPGSQMAKNKEREYRIKMDESLSKKPPRFREGGFSASISTVSLLPSEAIFGKSTKRVCDESCLHLGGEDGEKFNFEGE